MFGNTRGGFMRENTLSGRRKMFGWTAVAFIAAVPFFGSARGVEVDGV